MPQAVIIVFNPRTASPELWAAYHSFRRAAHAELPPSVAGLSDAECEREMREAAPLNESVRWVVLVEGAVIGSASVSYGKPGAPDAQAHAPHLRASGTVRPDACRQGVGTALLCEVLHLMHRLDKTVLTVGSRTEAGHAFLTSAGAVPRLTAITSRVALKELDLVALREWEDAQTISSLQWECYARQVPRERLLELLPEFTAVFAGETADGLQAAPVRFEIESYDRLNSMVERTGSAHHLVLLKEPGGRSAGMTEAVWDARRPDTVYQALTVVARSWRGRGLGKALKAALLRQLHECHPAAEFVTAGVSEMNAAMRSINERSGFRLHSRFIQYQVTRHALDLWSSGHTRRDLFIM
jgi:RimJ/RimL family protein N-acetyltransferase